MYRRVLSKIWAPPFNLTISVSWKMLCWNLNKNTNARRIYKLGCISFLIEKMIFYFSSFISLIASTGQFSWQDFLYEMNETRRCRWLLELVFWNLSKVYSPSTDGCKNWCSFPFSPIQLSNDFTSEVSRARKKWQSGFLFSSLSFSSLFFASFFLMFYYNWLRGQDLVRDFIIRESGCPFHLGGIRVVGKSFWNMWMAGIAVWYKHEWTFR